MAGLGEAAEEESRKENSSKGKCIPMKKFSSKKNPKGPVIESPRNWHESPMCISYTAYTAERAQKWSRHGFNDTAQKAKNDETEAHNSCDKYTVEIGNERGADKIKDQMQNMNLAEMIQLELIKMMKENGSNTGSMVNFSHLEDFAGFIQANIQKLGCLPYTEVGMPTHIINITPLGQTH
ncbi:Uncharacterized protein Fot_05028 [Forsythia ovata]|uniref:Uncharacterized protein n=1 Tax=Forsythia ovata TaxID=205694 RepID=A0ABD1WP06_9LAMI